jgi:hypothetical protein
MNLDTPIPFTVLDPDAPVPFRVRVLPPSQEMRDFVVPRLGAGGVPEERPSGRRLPQDRRSHRRLRAA